MDRPDEDPLLVLRALNLGDLLVAVPALRGLRRHHPDRPIVLATPAVLTPLAVWSGAVDEVLPTGTAAELAWDRPGRPWLAVNLHGTGPQSHHALDRTRPARRIGCRAPGWDGPDWADITRRHAHERERWCAVLAEFSIAADPADLRLPAPPSTTTGPPTVLIHPGAQYGAKRWPAERFAAVASALNRDGLRVLVTGTESELPLASEVAAHAALPAGSVLAGRTDLTALSTLVAHAALVICGDTGVAHLASAFGTPSVVLFGPVPPAQWGPPADGPHRTLTDDVSRRGDPFADDPDPALLGIGPADVIDAATRLLAAGSGQVGSTPAAAEPAATSSNRVVDRPGR